MFNLHNFLHSHDTREKHILIVIFILLALGTTVWTSLSPGYVSRGMANNVTLSFTGRPYSSKITCNNKTSAHKISTLHYVQANSYSDAQQVLETAFPSCTIGSLRSGRKGPLRKIIRMLL